LAGADDAEAELARVMGGRFPDARKDGAVEAEERPNVGCDAMPLDWTPDAPPALCAVAAIPAAAAASLELYASGAARCSLVPERIRSGELRLNCDAAPLSTVGVPSAVLGRCCAAAALIPS